jgi:hypothetical protein
MRPFIYLLMIVPAFIALAVHADETAKPRHPQLQILNGSNETVEIFWLKSDSERVPNGSVAPGKDLGASIRHRRPR